MPLILKMVPPRRKENEHAMFGQKTVFVDVVAMEVPKCQSSTRENSSRVVTQVCHDCIVFEKIQIRSQPDENSNVHIWMFPQK